MSQNNQDTLNKLVGVHLGKAYKYIKGVSYALQKNLGKV